MEINDLADLLHSRISEYQRCTRGDIAHMESSLGLQIRSFYSDLTTDVHRLRNENSRTTDALKAAIDDIERSIRNSVERLNRQNNLVLTGVPYVRGECLMSYYYAWCDTLGYTRCCVPLTTIKRLSRRNARSSVIRLSFALRSQRNDFFSRYLRTCTLSLKSIGFPSDKRIYVNEDLGPNDRKLRTRALKLRRNGNIHSVFTRKGVVYVRPTPTHCGIAVTSSDTLDRYSKNRSPFP